MVDTADGDVKRWALSRVGTVIKGKYRLDEVIGVGGMAVVFKATHRNQAEFALKMLLPELSFRHDLKTRFLREGYAANSVKHSGVVQVVDDDETDEGAAFLVMELLRGSSVEALWMKHDRRMPVQMAVGIVDQLLDVLTAAHGKGIVHRDIKPANLFLTYEGALKVLDFGIARVRDAMASAGSGGTHTGVLLGTPAFMAPEQAKALSHAIDAQTDLWAAGATLFTLVTGRFVHEGENAPQLLINTATTAARSISTVVSHVPPAIAAVVDRSLAFEKANRWPTADAMRASLRGAYQSTYGALPTREMLSSPPPLGASSAPVLPAATGPQITAPLPPVAASEPRMLGATTAQPISRQPYEPLGVRSRAPIWVVLGALASLLVIGAGAFVVLNRSGADAASADPPRARSASAAPPPIVTPSASAVVEVTASASAKPVESAQHATVPITHPSVSHAPAVQPKPTNCNPAYYYDSNNVKVWKKDCL